MTSEPGNRFREIGVVEGFYGPVWEPAQREKFVEALRPFGLNTYLYCPKHEPPLASEVMAPLAGADVQRLGGLAAFCRERGIAPWAGLHLEPPLEVTRPEHLAAAAEKCAALYALGFTGFTVLFDDLRAAPDLAAPGGPFQGSLARAQAHAVRELRGRAEQAGVAAEWLVCPSLYTLDPIVAREYGPFEFGYLARLDAALPPEVGWLWTGPRVVSRTVTLTALAAWRGAATRPVVLWDNYPVNDAGMVGHLHLGPLRGRAPQLPRGVRGYLFNPLLQPALGALPGATCMAYAAAPAGYQPQAAWQKALAALMPPAAGGPLRLWEGLLRHCCEGMHPPPPEDGLGPALARAWEQIGQGAPPESGPITALGDLLADLRAHLPPDALAEARPWLERLGLALEVFRAAAEGRESAAARAAYRQGGANVLGKWFAP